MTIDEAIKYEKAEIKGERQLYDNGGFAEYHEQLVKWLEELKIYKESNISIKNYQQGRADAYEEASDGIDRLATFYAGDKDGNPITPKMLIKDDVMKVLETLKEQKE